MENPFLSVRKVECEFVPQNAALSDGADGQTIFDHHKLGQRPFSFEFYPEQLFVRLVMDNKIGQSKQPIRIVRTPVQCPFWD